MPSIQQTTINGNRHSWTSIEVRMGGLAFPGAPFQSINYRYSKKGTKVFGNGVLPIGRTRGQLDWSGDVELLRSEWDAFVAYANLQLLDQVSQGFMDLDFTIVVSYSENEGTDVTTDTLYGCRIEDGDHTNSQGTDPTKVKMSLSIMNGNLNGFWPAGESSGLTLGVSVGAVVGVL